MCVSSKKASKLVIRCHTTVMVVLCIVVYLSGSGSQVTLSTSEVDQVYVCPGEQLVINCSTSREFLEWNVTVILNGSERASRTRLAVPFRQQTLNIIKRSFLIDARNTYDFAGMVNGLESTLSTDITADLNGTEVNCTDIGVSFEFTSSSVTTVHVIRSDNAFTSVNRRVLMYGINNVTVTLTWKPILEQARLSYNLSVSPMIGNSASSFITNTSVLLTLAYNSLYNVSLVATVCQQSNSINFTELKYVKCEDPSEEIDEDLRVVSYSDPAVEGTMTTLECSSSDMVLIGSNRITCTDNGLWKPNPRQIACRRSCGVPSLDSDVISWRYNSTLEGSVIQFWCNESPDKVLTAVCSEDGTWSLNLNNFAHCSLRSDEISTVQNNDLQIVVVSSTVTMALIAFMSITIFACCIFKYRHQRNKAEQSQVQGQSSQPIYDTPTVGTAQELEMTENVAYGPLSSQDV